MDDDDNCVCSYLNSSVFTTPSQRQVLETAGVDDDDDDDDDDDNNCVCSCLDSSVFTTPSQRQVLEKTGADDGLEKVQANLDSLLLDTCKTPSARSARTPGSKRSVPCLSGGQQSGYTGR